MSHLLWTYALTKEQVDYLLKVLDSVQVRGEASAASLLRMLQILRSPLNAEPEKEPDAESADHP